MNWGQNLGSDKSGHVVLGFLELALGRKLNKSEDVGYREVGHSVEGQRP